MLNGLAFLNASDGQHLVFNQIIGFICGDGVTFQCDMLHKRLKYSLIDGICVDETVNINKSQSERA
ncbi:hypothetical protein D3C81_2182750 [compost metagenome]